MSEDTSSDLPRVMPRKRDEVMVAEFDTESVVLVPEIRKAHHLDEGLSLVLDSCDGSTTTADVINEIAEATGDSPEAVADWLGNALGQLGALDMLEQAEHSDG